MIQERDDMQLFEYEYKGHKYYYRIIDCNIKERNGKYDFFVDVFIDDKYGKSRLFTFRLSADEIDLSQFTLEKKIRETADRLEKEGKSWQD